MKMNFEYEVVPPGIPNFVTVRRHEQKLRSELKDTPFHEFKISIGDLTDEQIDQIGADWIKRMKESAAARRRGE